MKKEEYTKQEVDAIYRIILEKIDNATTKELEECLEFMNKLEKKRR